YGRRPGPSTKSEPGAVATGSPPTVVSTASKVHTSQSCQHRLKRASLLPNCISAPEHSSFLTRGTSAPLDFLNASALNLLPPAVPHLLSRSERQTELPGAKPLWHTRRRSATRPAFRSASISRTASAMLLRSLPKRFA